MGWEAVADYHINHSRIIPIPNLPPHPNEKSFQKIDHKVKQISKDKVYPKSLDEFIADH